MAVLTCALVNNLPDGAFVTSERQFVDLLHAGRPPGTTVEVHCHTLPSDARAAHVARHIEACYTPLDQLRWERPDVIIITGSEPRTSDLAAERYFAELISVVEWAVANTRSVLLSCLAAHAALLAFDGLERHRLAVKCSGVFDHEVRTGHALTTALVAPVALPHSRVNDLTPAEVAGAGYDVVMMSEEVGWGVITRRVGACLMVLVQGHPEYDPTTLLREYRRDAARYVSGVRTEQPCLPWRCVAPEDRQALADFHLRLISEPTHPSSLSGLPFEAVARRAPWPWRAAAIRLYTNWLAEVSRPPD